MKVAGKQQKVLVVDDDPGIRRTLTMCLQDAYDITAVPSGELAIEACAAEEFSVVVLDLRMEGISGIETLQQLKRREESPNVIILTAYESKETAISAINYGAFNYLTKPFDRKHLRTVVAEGCAAWERQHQRDRLMREKLEEIHHSFFSLLCHEFKTPLNGILGFAELLNESLTDPEHASWARAVGESGDRLHELLMEMVDYVNASHLAAEHVEDKFVPWETLEPLVGEFARKKIHLDITQSGRRMVKGPSRMALVIARQLAKIVSRQSPSILMEIAVKEGRMGSGELWVTVSGDRSPRKAFDTWDTLPLWYTFAAGGREMDLDTEIVALREVAHHAGGMVELGRPEGGDWQLILRLPVRL